MLQPLCWSHKLQVTGRRWRRIKADKGKKIKDKGGQFAESSEAHLYPFSRVP